MVNYAPRYICVRESIVSTLYVPRNIKSPEKVDVTRMQPVPITKLSLGKLRALCAQEILMKENLEAQVVYHNKKYDRLAKKFRSLKKQV